jgi:predicted RNase H-like HicB family nuclease
MCLVERSIVYLSKRASRSVAMNDKYLVVIEKAEDGSYSAYLPDVPGCVSCGDTIEEVKAMIREALSFHLEGMKRSGFPLPISTSTSDYVMPANAG